MLRRGTAEKRAPAAIPRLNAKADSIILMRDFIGAFRRSLRAFAPYFSGRMEVNHSISEDDDLLLASFDSVFANQDALFEVAGLFPFPIQIFSPDGETVFANRALLEMWNISDASQIVGKYNLIKDPVVNGELNLTDYVQRVFRGETVRVPDVKVPLKAFAQWYTPRKADYTVNCMYVDILNFPILNDARQITHIVSVFTPNRVYTRKSDATRAKEYIEAHWIGDFDMEKIARAVCLSRYHLARVFKKQMGVTPYAYYQEIKIKKLKEALRDMDSSVAQAFSACGVKYSGKFAKLFREKVGMTPTQYRKSLEKDL